MTIQDWTMLLSGMTIGISVTGLLATVGILAFGLAPR